MGQPRPWLRAVRGERGAAAPTAPVKPPGRGIYLLPNLFTTAGLFSGFYAIVAAMGQHYEAAAIAVFVAMVMDGIDGRIARLTHTQSDFGAQYDSLADMVAFGLAPALVIYHWSLADLKTLGWFWGKLGWLAAFVYVAAAALRLARFNTQVGRADKRYFQGLPSPAAAAVVAGTVWVGVDWEISGGTLAWPLLPLTVVLAALMVSNIRYYSFKDIDLKGRIPFVKLLLLVLGFVLVSLDPSHVLWLAFLAYAGSGPVYTLLAIRKHRAARKV